MPRPISSWRFVHAGGETLAVTPRVIGASVDDLSLGALAASQGLGAAYLPRGLAGRSPELVEISLGDWKVEDRELYAKWNAAKAEKDFAAADEYRRLLAEKGLA